MRFDSEKVVKIRDAYAARHEPEAARVLATFFWAILMTFTVVICILVIGYGAWEFTRPLASGDGSSVTVGARKVLSRSDIQKVLEALEARAGLFEERRAAPIPVRDPSL
jgi:hypothetical protein